MTLRQWWWRIVTRTARTVTRRRPAPPSPNSRLELIVRQVGTDLHVTAATGVGLNMTALAYRGPDEAHTRLDAVKPVIADGAARVRAVIDLADLADRFPADDGQPFVEARLRMEITSRQARPPAHAVLDSSNPDGTISYQAPLGRFRHTELTDIAPVRLHDGRLATVRVTVNGHLIVRFGPQPPPPDAECLASHAAVVDGILTVRGRIDNGAGPVTAARLILQGRGLTHQVAATVTELTFDARRTAARRGRWQYDYAASLDLRGLIDPDLPLPPHSIADLSLELISGYDGAEVATRRIGGLPFEERKTLHESTLVIGDTALEAIPYYTFKMRNISFRLEQYAADAYRMLTGLTERAPKHTNGKPIWLIGERPNTAQDNGYRLFRYLREQRPDIDAHYVITADSLDRRNLAGLDGVVTFGSTDHMRLALAANRVIGTHHADYLFPSQSRAMIRAVDARRVFLQHGVMGSKWMTFNYGKYGSDFATDLFCVSSERERELIVTDFGYRPDEVAVTGLARFDTLFADDVPVIGNQVLIAPTWRDWLGTEEALAQSDYLREWRELATRLAADHGGAAIKLYLHSNMQRYAHYFADIGVELIEPGTVDLQYLLKQSAVLITDYSSSAFDFSFLHRPVIYFQFDRHRFFGDPGSHLDLDAELPGFVATTADLVLARLAEVLRPGFRLEGLYTRRADRFIAHRDRRNCERITAAVEAMRPRRTVADRVRGSEQVRLAGERFRRSKRYFGAMRLLYRAAKLLPMDRRTIVFEADTGKSFADSPRVIYEELLRRGDPRRRVWIYDRTPPVIDPGRVVIKRFSPRYFTTLARAKYWVSNQNLPHYITRRRRGTYLQTWHGTPLKKMQHDLTQIIGRDDGYLDRVTQAAAQWTHLLSPSPYATASFRSAFRFTGEVLELGYPRNDVLAGPDAPRIRREIRARLGLDDATRVVLYAPTFRDDQKRGKSFIFDLPIDLDRFAAEFGADTVLLLRTHRLVASTITIPEAAAHCVRDLSHHTDIAELYLAADVLIADYSSVMFDFAITGRPILYYPYDLASYRDEVRGFYLDYEAEMPGPIAITQDELFANLRSSADPVVAAGLSDRVAAFARRFAPLDDGHAAERVVDAIF